MFLVREAVTKLTKLGPLPDEKQDIADGIIERYEKLLHSISSPVTQAEAEKLVVLFPPHGCFGLDWTLLHLIEMAPGWPLLGAIERCPSDEWKQRILDRAANM